MPVDRRFSSRRRVDASRLEPQPWETPRVMEGDAGWRPLQNLNYVLKHAAHVREVVLEPPPTPDYGAFMRARGERDGTPFEFTVPFRSAHVARSDVLSRPRFSHVVLRDFTQEVDDVRR